MKLCAGCLKVKVIWKSQGRDKYCKACWLKISPPGKVLRQAPPRKKSAKRKVQDIEYSSRRKIFLADNPLCKAGLPGCTSTATQVHHMAGRTGNLYLDVTHWFPICHSCHQWVTVNSREAIELGFSIPRTKKTER